MADVYKSYRAGIPGCSARARVLRGVSLELHCGEVLAIVGAPLSGRTTLLRCAAGLLRPDRGTVHHAAGGASVVRADWLPLARPHDTYTVASVLLIENPFWRCPGRTVRSAADQGIAVLAATSDARAAHAWADRVLLLEQGVLRPLAQRRNRSAARAMAWSPPARAASSSVSTWVRSRFSPQ